MNNINSIFTQLSIFFQLDINVYILIVKVGKFLKDFLSWPNSNKQVVATVYVRWRKVAANM